MPTAKISQAKFQLQKIFPLKKELSSRVQSWEMDPSHQAPTLARIWPSVRPIKRQAPLRSRFHLLRLEMKLFLARRLSQVSNKKLKELASKRPWVPKTPPPWPRSHTDQQQLQARRLHQAKRKTLSFATKFRLKTPPPQASIRNEKGVSRQERNTENQS